MNLEDLLNAKDSTNLALILMSPEFTFDINDETFGDSTYGYEEHESNGDNHLFVYSSRPKSSNFKQLYICIVHKKVTIYQIFCEHKFGVNRDTKEIGKADFYGKCRPIFLNGTFSLKTVPSTSFMLDLMQLLQGKIA